MASFDFGSVTAFKFAASGTITANTNTGAIDTAGFEGVALVSVAGVTANINVAAPVTINFLEGNDTNIANATNVPASSIGVNPPITASNVAVHASVRPTKRYLFAQYIVPANGSVVLGSAGALGYPNNAPTQ